MATEDSQDLAAQLRELEAEFERGLREKERLFEELGLTPERLQNFEKKLSPKDRRRYEATRAEVERQLASSGPQDHRPARSVKARGIRV
jgi:hypothetical protein